MDEKTGIRITRNEVEKDLIQDGDEIERFTGVAWHRLAKIGSFGGSWERPSFSRGLTKADDDDDEVMASNFNSFQYELEEVVT